MNDTLGLILAGVGDAPLGELTRMRSVAALPVCGRYRLIDFLLSSMVNSGIANVGVPTLTAYRSLMDHLGSGKEWDLNRKLYGLFILPPYIDYQHTDAFRGDLDVLDGIADYLSRSKQEYVLLCGCSALFNTTFYALRERHLDTGADVTVMCCSQLEAEPGAAPRHVAVTGWTRDGSARPQRHTSRRAAFHGYLVYEKKLFGAADCELYLARNARFCDGRYDQAFRSPESIRL